MLLLPGVASPSPAKVVTAWRKLNPRGPALELVEGGDSGVAAFELDDLGAVMLAHMPMPIPTGEAEETAQASVCRFFQGPFELPPHKSHAVVTVASTDLENQENTARFTRVLAALATASGAIGVYWGNAGVTHPAKFFVQMAAEETTASMLWTGVSLAREAKGRSSFLSLGMGLFRQMDFMVGFRSEKMKDALLFFLDMHTYVVGRGEALPDGDTVGRTEKEKLKVRHVASPIDKAKKVWRVDLP
jgi:hypothetical protein